MRKAVLWTALLLVPLVAIAAPDALERYHTLQTVAQTRAALSSDDSLDFATPVNAYRTQGNPTVVVHPVFDTADATVTIEVALYGGTAGPFLGLATVTTATASNSGYRVDGSDIVTDSAVIVADTFGAPFYDVRVRDVSAGTVDLTAWTAGAVSEKAQ